jgi:hypothetical protein
MTLHSTLIEWIQIQLKGNGIPIGSENLFVIMVLKKNFEMTQIPKDTFPLFGTWELVKQLSILNYPNDNFWIIQIMTYET